MASIGRLTLISILLQLLSFSCAIGQWGFNDASVLVSGKGAGVGASKEKFSQKKPLSRPLSLASAENLKIVLTTQEDDKPKRPHQTFLNLRDPTTHLETSFPFQVKESGKSKLEITQKDIPTQLLSSPGPLSGSIIVASFGSSKPYNGKVFDLNIELDHNSPQPPKEKPIRYGKLPEIHHVFKSDPTSPPKIISVVFTVAVITTFPALLFAWFSLGANLNHLSKAIGDAPVPHVLFFLSIVGMEVIFFMYYVRWNLFQTLPAIAATGLVTFLSGSRALREVQQRRLDGVR